MERIFGMCEIAVASLALQCTSTHISTFLKWNKLELVSYSRLWFLELQNLTTTVLGTGTKCLGQNEISDQGDLVHDSHAEVIAKRAFVLYLMTEVKKCLEGQSGEGILRKVKGQDDLVELDPDVTLYFYTSFPPCGDATISQKVSFTYNILCGVLDREGIELCTALFDRSTCSKRSKE